MAFLPKSISSVWTVSQHAECEQPMLRRLDVQIILLLSLILTTMISVFGWRIASRQSDLYVRTMAENARVLSATHAANAAHLLVVNEFAGLEEQMLEVARLPNILSINVMEMDGTVLCDLARPSLKAEPKLSYRRDKVAVPSRRDAIMLQENGRLVSWTPILAGKPLGWLKITFSLRAVEEMRESIWENILLMGTLWIVVGIGLMYLVLKPPLQAIRELSFFARDLNRHKGRQVNVARGAMEIDLLTDALNHASAELQAAEERLDAERERLSVTIRSIGEGVLACDREGRVMLMNRAAEVLTGWDATEAFGQPFDKVFRVADENTGEPITVPLQRIVEAGRAIEFVAHALLVARDGARRNIADSGAPIINAQGESIGVVIVFRDETEWLQAERARLELEGQLRQSQKMEAIGHLAGGIAHDFNNILTAIMGYSSMLIEMAGVDEQRRSVAEKILHASERASSLTRGLLAFSRKQKMEMQTVDLNAIIRNLEQMLRRIIGEDIDLKTDLAEGALLINADVSQIEQVMLNLVTNARDAMASGGLLSIVTLQTMMDASSREFEGTLPVTGSFALLCISDSGIGMDEATVQRIFEPFFTTKRTGKGTGLGLSIVHGIIQQHGGLIRVYSNEGIGTTFKIYLPLVADGEAVTAAVEDTPARGGNERILLVEDETEVRQVLKLMLQKGGYHVVEASDGDEAWELLQKDHTGIRLVVSDLIMPRMTGKELLDRIREHLPAIRVLFISGYTFDVIQYKGILEGEVDLLMKPFTANRFLTRVREALDR
ncbi:MAG: response regulator [Geobacter sp.]|nr:response regulator [Geobacter sp.]